MGITVINGPTIAAGQSLSDIIDCSAGTLVRITMPAAWTSAMLSFQVSSDGAFFNDLHNVSGEIKFPVVPGVGMIFPDGQLAAVQFLRFRSGTAAYPINQEAERLFSVALKTPETTP